MLDTPEISQKTLKSPYKNDVLNAINKQQLTEQSARDQVAGGLKNMRKSISNSIFVAHRRENINERRLREEAEENSMTDVLTGLKNRRYFTGDKKKEDDIGELGQEFAEAIRFNHDLTLLMVDIDYFKSVNDTYGHSVGDEFLQILADAMRKTFRQVDILTRHGGEEFCILLPETDTNNMKELVDRFHKKFEDLQKRSGILDRNKILAAKTISIGATSLKDEKGNPRYGDDKKYEDFLAEADNAMYAAKYYGRNRTVIFGSDEYKEYMTNKQEQN